MPKTPKIPPVAADNPAFFNAAARESLFFSEPWFSNLLAGVPELAASPAWSLTPSAMLPMQRSGDGKRSPLQLTAVRNYYSSLYGPIGDVYREQDSTAVQQLASSTVRKFPHTDVIQLDPLADDWSTTALEAGFHNAGWATRRFNCFGNWYLPCEGIAWADYLAERPGQVRSTIKRKGKKFAALEGARLQMLIAPPVVSGSHSGGNDGDSNEQPLPLSDDQIDQAIAAWTQIYNASWKKPEPYPEFVPGLIRMAAKQGWLRFGVAWLGDVPIAAQIWITLHGKANIYKLAYDEEYKQHAAGTLLSAMLFEHALDVDEVNEIDYLTGDDGYKRDWMTERRERIGLLAFNRQRPWGMAQFLKNRFGETWQRFRRG